jgi:hypothetical protein
MSGDNAYAQLILVGMLCSDVIMLLGSSLGALSGVPMKHVRSIFPDWAWHWLPASRFTARGLPWLDC